MGARFSRLIQWGRENTSGTAVAANRYCQGNGCF